MVSIEDVAQRAGVSVATVSRALRGLPNVADDTRRRVEAAARALDYVQDPSAARLAAGRTGTLGIVVPSLGTWFHGRVMAAVHAAAAAARHDLLAIVVDDHAERDRFVRDLPFRKRVDGLLVVDVPFSTTEYERLLGTGVAIVSTGHRSDEVSSVGIDDRSASREATEHLLALGHTQPAVIEGSLSEPFRFAGPPDRRRGIVDALADAGIDYEDCPRVTADWTAAGGADAMASLLDDGHRPSAVIAFSDELAFGALTTLRAAGQRVPQDVSVVGFDDHELAEHLGLTTVHQPVELLGTRAAERLLAAISRPVDAAQDTEHELLETRLVVRRTTAPRREHHAATTTGDVAVADDLGRATATRA